MFKLSLSPIIFILITLFVVSCSTEQSNNLEHISKLKEGMSKAEVLQVMGEPLKNEVYNKDNLWFYYTDWKWIDGSRTSDECTPLVFENDKLIGWGQEFYKKYRQKDW